MRIKFAIIIGFRIILRMQFRKASWLKYCFEVQFRKSIKYTKMPFEKGD